MALFKNLYLDLKFLNPFKKKEFSIDRPPIPKHKRQLPSVSKRLVQESKEAVVKPELPKIKKPIVQPPRFSPEKIQPLVNKPQKSFFNTLYDHISKEESYMHSNLPKEVLHKNLFNEMQSFWQDKKGELRKAALNKVIKQDLSKKIESLQQLEIEWQKMQLQYDKLKDGLASKEILIENSIRELKKAFKKVHIESDIHPDHHFVLSNGVTLKNLPELTNALRTMDSNIFVNHVNNTKNDFAAWINDIMGFKSLSQDIAKAKSKEQMVDLLENWTFSF
jgi:hypothetical protein